MPNGTVRKGLWEDQKRQQWIDISPEDMEYYKGLLHDALKKSEEVEVKKAQAMREFEAAKRGQDILE